MDNQDKGSNTKLQEAKTNAFRFKIYKYRVVDVATKVTTKSCVRRSLPGTVPVARPLTFCAPADWPALPWVTQS